MKYQKFVTTDRIPATPDGIPGIGNTYANYLANADIQVNQWLYLYVLNHF